MLTFRKLFLLLFAFAFSISFFSSAQRRCGTVEYSQKLQAQNFVIEKDQQFESWLRKKQVERRSSRSKAVKYKIPVVIHIIHNGEPVGQGANISQQQVLSQLKVLNNDFQRKNADTVNTPSDFTEVAAGMDIEFVLAKRNPDGFATSGIVRVNGARDQWFSHSDVELKSLSYWPAEDYLNIWVCNLIDFLGYAQFPVSNLPGLEGSPENRLTDGLVVSHKCFGSIDDGNFNLDNQYDKGRTATHEISHFFGLRHIWGDTGGCNGTDFVDDTPNQESNTSGCPGHPRSSCSPPVVTMFQNFTDYTDDRCMNMFTLGQVERMETVLENSPRRASLLTSTALLPPDLVENDLGLANVLSPYPSQCDGEIEPSIEIVNRGKNDITSASVSLFIDDRLIETRQLNLNLQPAESENVTFAPVQVNDGNAALKFEIVSVNGTDDGNTQDNVRLYNVLIDKQRDVVPFRQTFEDAAQNWSVVNPGSGMLWEPVTTNYQTSIYFNSFRNLNAGDESWLVSPVVDLTRVTEPSLVFDLSAAKRSTIDDLKVLVSTDCGSTYQTLDYTLPDSFKTLASNWVPAVEKDWAAGQYISLKEFVGHDNVRVAFVVKNASGNNIYLDNIEFFVNNDPREARIENQFSIYGYSNNLSDSRKLKIGFNLETRQDIHLEITDRMGRVVATGIYNDVLNQVFDLPITDYMKAGLYLVRIKIDNGYRASRIVLRD